MNIEEYENKLNEINAACEKRKVALMSVFAYSNNKVKVGDIVKSSNAIIKVESISVEIGYFGINPECFYKGIKLTKERIPRKNKSTTKIAQSEIEEISKDITNE